MLASLNGSYWMADALQRIFSGWMGQQFSRTNGRFPSNCREEPYCVLVGDAAHALPPRSGQGASQAFEDGQSLGLLLARHLQKHGPAKAISRTIDAFSANLRGMSEVADLNEELLAVVRETVQPSHASLWLRDTAAGPAARNPS